jgi:Na+/H+ antiporter NhaA
MPVFALANAGIAFPTISADALLHHQPVEVVVGVVHHPATVG